MSYPDNGSPYGVLASGSARTEMVLTNLLDDRPTLLLDDSADVIAAEVAAIKADRKLAEARAKLQAAEMGGTTPDLTLEEVRLNRAALRFAAEATEGWVGCPDAVTLDGVTLAHGPLMALRKRFNAGVSRGCERRTEAGK